MIVGQQSGSQLVPPVAKEGELDTTYAPQIEEFVRRVMGEYIFHETDAYHLARVLAGLEANTYILKKKFPELRDIDKIPDIWVPLLEWEFIVPCLRDLIENDREFIRESRMIYASKMTLRLMEFIAAVIGIEISVFETSKLILRTSWVQTEISGDSMLGNLSPYNYPDPSFLPPAPFQSPAEYYVVAGGLYEWDGAAWVPSTEPIPAGPKDIRVSKLGRIRDGVLWSYYVYIVIVEGGSSSAELLKRFFDCIHPAGTRSFWFFSDDIYIPWDGDYDLLEHFYIVMNALIEAPDPYPYDTPSDNIVFAEGALGWIIESYSDIGSYWNMQTHGTTEND